MKKILQTVIILGVLAVCSSTRVLAVVSTFEMWFDENGNGTASLNHGPILPVPSGVEAEPGSGKTAVFYLLPALAFPGDARVWEDPAKTILNDLLRFTLDGLTAKMYVFSAKTGFPGSIDPNDLGGVVLDNGQFTYEASGNIYHGRVPDAGPTFALSALAMLLPLFLRRLHR